MRINRRKPSIATVATKRCCRCTRDLEASEFYPHRRMKSGLQSHCRKCSRAWHHERPDYVRAKNAAFKAKNPTYAVDRHRITKFGVSPDQLKQMSSRQGGLCAGCLRDFRDTLRGPHVDHCHKTGVVRGLLCRDCNLILGHARDKSSTLIRLVTYLESTSARAEAEAY